MKHGNIIVVVIAVLVYCSLREFMNAKNQNSVYLNRWLLEEYSEFNSTQFLEISPGIDHGQWLVLSLNSKSIVLKIYI